MLPAKAAMPAVTKKAQAPPPVHVICDVAAIEHLPKHVAQVVPWYSLIGLQIVEQHIPTGGQVTHVEGVTAAEAQAAACPRPNACAEFLAPQQQGVVEA